jgi:hypothetical protein
MSVAKSKEVKTESNLTESSKEGYVQKNCFAKDADNYY